MVSDEITCLPSPEWVLDAPIKRTHNVHMTNNIRRYREAKGLSRPALAELLGTSLSQVVKLERGERRLTQDWMTRLSEVLDVRPVDLIESSVVPVVGRVGAGAAVVPIESDGDNDLGEVEAPPGAGPYTVAVEVEGGSMAGQADDGSILYFDERHDPPDPTFIGKLCVVWAEDGRVLVKRLGFGSATGLWSLISSGGGVERDVALKSAAKVLWIKPA